MTFDWSKLDHMSIGDLVAAGWGRWNDPDHPDLLCDPAFSGKTLMLIPGALYDEIPAGLIVMGITGHAGLFEPGRHSRDSRVGFLAYGVLR